MPTAGYPVHLRLASFSLQPSSRHAASHSTIRHLAKELSCPRHSEDHWRSRKLKLLKDCEGLWRIVKDCEGSESPMCVAMLRECFACLRVRVLSCVACSGGQGFEFSLPEDLGVFQVVSTTEAPSLAGQNSLWTWSHKRWQTSRQPKLFSTNLDTCGLIRSRICRLSWVWPLFDWITSTDKEVWESLSQSDDEWCSTYLLDKSQAILIDSDWLFLQHVDFRPASSCLICHLSLPCQQRCLDPFFCWI